MNINMSKKYHGFIVLPRHSKLLYQELGYELFGFYLALVMQAPWDRRNENFGRIIKSQAQLAKEFNMNQSTISRRLTELENHKYFILRNQRQKYIILGYFPLFLYEVASQIHSKDYSNINELYADMHKVNAELQENYADMQDRRTQSDSQRLYISSNDNVSLPELTYEIDVDDVDEGISRMIKERED